MSKYKNGKITAGSFGGKRTPRQVLAEAIGNADDIRVCVIIYCTNDDFIHTTWSDGDSLLRIGLMHHASQVMSETGDNECY